MGGSSSKIDTNFDASQWERVENEHADDEDDEIAVVRNKQSGELLDLYSLTFPNQQEFEKYIDSIRYRRNEKNIVRVVAYDPKVIKEFCGASYMLDVYLEHCRSRLSKYEDIPFPDYLYCGLAMLDGYKKLYDRIGKFHVTERQVIIDENGEVRVWLNEDFCENEAQFIPQVNFIHNSHEEEFEMVDSIMRMVFENSDESEGPNNTFTDFYQRESRSMNGQVGFEQAKMIIKRYSLANNVEIPSLFKSVFEVYQNDSGKNNDNFLLANELSDQDHDANMSLDKVAQLQYRPVESLVNNQVQSTQMQPIQYPVAAPGFARASSNQNLAQTQNANRELKGGQVFQGPPIHSQRTQPYFSNHHFVHPSQNISHQSTYHQNQSSGLGMIRIPPPSQRPITNIPHRAFPMQVRPGQVGIPFGHHSYPQPQALPHGQQHPYQLQSHLVNRGQNPYPGHVWIGENNREHLGEMGADELEIEKKLMLKDSGNVEEFINEANIIKELSEFHRIEHVEKTRRSFGNTQPEIHEDSPQNRDQNEEPEEEIKNYYASKNVEREIIPDFASINGTQHGANYVNFQQISSPEKVSRHLYYTLDNEVELDPEIAADIASYMKA